jgi:hypothetical protein
MDCLSELGGGMSMSDVMSETIQKWIDRFVDDTSLLVNIPPDDNDSNDIIQRLHKLLNHDMIYGRKYLKHLAESLN